MNFIPVIQSSVTASKTAPASHALHGFFYVLSKEALAPQDGASQKTGSLSFFT
jgi:hypothetical protein